MFDGKFIMLWSDLCFKNSIPTSVKMNHCGKDYVNDDIFCSKCGIKLSQRQTESHIIKTLDTIISNRDFWWYSEIKNDSVIVCPNSRLRDVLCRIGSIMHKNKLETITVNPLFSGQYSEEYIRRLGGLIESLGSVRLFYHHDGKLYTRSEIVEQYSKICQVYDIDKMFSVSYRYKNIEFIHIPERYRPSIATVHDIASAYANTKHLMYENGFLEGQAVTTLLGLN